MNSRITDSISAAFNYPVQYNPVENYDLGFYTAKHFVLLKDAPEGWYRVGLQKMVAYANKHNRVEIEQVELVVLRYFDKDNFNKYAIA